MRLLIVAPHFPPTHVGGVENIAHYYAVWLQRAGHRVDVVCVDRVHGGTGVEASREERDGYTVHRVTLGVGAQDFRLLHEHTALQAWCEALIRECQPDVVHAHSGYLTGAPALSAARTLGVPTVLTLHDYWFICPRITLLQPDGTCCPGPEPARCTWCLQSDQRRFRWADRATAGGAGAVGRALIRASLVDRKRVRQLEDRNAYLRSLLLGVDVVLSPSRFLHALMTEAGVPADRIRVQSTGIAPQPLWQRRRAATDALHIGYIGRIVESKGVHVLIEAARALPFENWSVAIHGPVDVDARYTSRLRTMIAGDTRFRVMGGFTGNEQPRVFADLDVLVVPSVWYENRPLVILEAQSAGLPVIASRLGGMAELLDHGRTGLLFDPGDAADLARQLTTVRQDPGLTDMFGANRASILTVDEELTHLQAVYEGLVA